MKIEWELNDLFNFGNKLADTSRYEREMRSTIKEVAHELLRKIKQYTPIGDSWQLINGWDNNDLAVRKIPSGFEILLINRTLYARWVNDGHKQRPGRFIPGHIIGNRFYYDPTADDGMILKRPFVKGRLFVEKGILDVSNNATLEGIIEKHLENWWKGCF